MLSLHLAVDKKILLLRWPFSPSLNLIFRARDIPIAMLFNTVLFLAAVALRVNAWGDTLGHPATGELAQTLLSANAKKIILPLLDSTFSSSLGGQTCNWADTWRTAHKETAPFHFVDMMAAPPTSCGFNPSDCVGGNCIIGAITNQTAILLSNKCAASTATTQAVQFLAHFLGDITQPLHNCNRDLGGNNDKVTYNGASTNFHAIHDTQILATRSSEVGATTAASYAAFLAKTYASKSSAYTTSSYIDIHTLTPEGFLSAAVNMANDGNALDCSKSAFWTLYDQDPSQDFSGNYYTQTKLLLEEQVAKGGWRMAAWFNAIADACSGTASTSSTSSSTSTSTSTKTTSTKTTSTKTSTTTTSMACAHSICATGAPLKAGCDACAKKIIAADPYCGKTKWSYICVDEVSSVCGLSC
ncbi:hypothetical protein HK101_011247 [Irineochytrium annulatum]|nr:hypothetical protein HK101_011247 [Irineochytrium annulatum]